MRHLYLGVIPLSVLFVFIWSSGWIGSKYGLDSAGTFSLLTWRYLFVVLILVALVTIFKAWRKLSAHELIGHFLIGVLSHAVYLSTSLYAMDFGVSVGMVAFVLALQPMLTSVIAAPLTGEKTSLRQWLGVVMGLVAVLVVVGDKLSLGGSPIAYSLLILATFGITLGSLISRQMEKMPKKKAKREIPMLLMLLIHCTGALFYLTPMAGLFEGYAVDWEPSFIFSLTYLALIISIGAYALMYILLSKMSATKVSSLLYLSPAATMIIAYFAFGEKLTFIDIAGLVLAAIAVCIVTFEKSSTEAGHVEPEPPKMKNRPEQSTRSDNTIIIRNPHNNDGGLAH